MEYGKTYRILVESYMTKKSNSKFTFMREFNHDVPIPKTVMTGKLLDDKGKLAKLALRGDAGEEWMGWVIKSAIRKAVCIDGPAPAGPVKTFISNGKTTVVLGTDMEVKERATFLLGRFESKGAAGTELWFPAMDFEDICMELTRLGITVEANPGNYFNRYLIPTEKNWSLLFRNHHP